MKSLVFVICLIASYGVLSNNLIFLQQEKDVSVALKSFDQPEIATNRLFT